MTKLLLVLMLVVPLIGGTSNKCATAEIVLSTGTSSPGTSFGVFTKVTNCGDKTTNFNLVITITDACGHTITFLQSDPADGKLRPGASLFQNKGYLVPEDACLGTYTIVATVKSSNGSQTVSTTSTTFEVTASE